MNEYLIDEEYVRRAEKYLDNLPHKEQEQMKKQLQELIAEASKKVTKPTKEEKTYDFSQTFNPLHF